MVVCGQKQSCLDHGYAKLAIDKGNCLSGSLCTKFGEGRGFVSSVDEAQGEYGIQDYAFSPTLLAALSYLTTKSTPREQYAYLVGRLGEERFEEVHCSVWVVEIRVLVPG
jgi:hypothetical protein